MKLRSAPHRQAALDDAKRQLGARFTPLDFPPEMVREMNEEFARLCAEEEARSEVK